MDDERIKVVVHHTRHFVSDDKDGKLKFDGERVEWSCDPDMWSYFGIVASVKDLGHIDVKELWLNDEVHLHVVHNTMEPEIIEMIDWVDAHVHDEGDVAREMVEGEVVGDGEVQREMVKGEVVGDGEVQREMVEGEVVGDGEVEREMMEGQESTMVVTDE
ncbi:hypothetical protein LR48_Vigan03g137100 [Vigna angularis]|uniref:PB1-like domain-containing protein n=1 Tax=Phaseolus angularis TaxID=3914 RepID=A0A0L9U6F7_PHAAN|nr:hypothetical protein LR48_Vigan03g137100 [Vigna angularis]